MFPVDIVIVGRVTLVDVWQGIKIPPTVVVIGPGMEIVPGEIGGLLRVVGALNRIAFFTVKVNAVAAGMVKYAVQNDMHPVCFRRRTQMLEIGLCTKQGIDFGIICGVITVIGMRLKDGIEIDTGHAERFQIGKFFFNAF